MTHERDPYRDDNRCGLKEWRTAKWDPYVRRACIAHDKAFQDKLDGKEHDSLGKVSLDWTKNTALTALIGAYAVATFPLYLLGGLIGGGVRWWSIKD